MNTTSDKPESDLQDTFYKLHEGLAKYFLTIVENPKPEMKASLYAVIAQFLRDNKVTLDSITANSLSRGLRVVHGSNTKDELSLPFSLDS